MKSFAKLKSVHSCNRAVMARFPGALEGFYVACNTEEGYNIVHHLLGSYVDTSLTPELCTQRLSVFHGSPDPWLHKIMRHTHRDRSAVVDDHYRILPIEGGIVIQWSQHHIYPKVTSTNWEPELSVRTLGRRFHQDTHGIVTDGTMMLCADHGMDWLSLHDNSSLRVDDVRRAITLAYFRSVLNRHTSLLWLHADCLARLDTGEAVLLLGPRNSGKTTLLHHCLHISDKTQLVSTSTTAITGGGEAVGLPLAGAVKVGTVLGTLLPNPKLERLLDPSEAVPYLANSEEQLWNIQRTFSASADVCYGRGRTRPTARVIATLILGWGGHAHKAMVRAASPSVLLEALAKYICREASMPDVESEGAVLAMQQVPVYEVAGGVQFESVGRFVIRDLLRLL